MNGEQTTMLYLPTATKAAGDWSWKILRAQPVESSNHSEEKHDILAIYLSVECIYARQSVHATQSQHLLQHHLPTGTRDAKPEPSESVNLSLSRRT